MPGSPAPPKRRTWEDRPRARSYLAQPPLPWRLAFCIHNHHLQCLQTRPSVRLTSLFSVFYSLTSFSSSSCGPSLAHATAIAVGAATCDLHHLPVAQARLTDAQNFRRKARFALARLHSVFPHLGVRRFNLMPFVAQTNVTPLSPTATLPPRPYSSATSNPSFRLPLQTRPIPTVSPAPGRQNSWNYRCPPSWTRPRRSSQGCKIRTRVTKFQ